MQIWNKSTGSTVQCIYNIHTVYCILYCIECVAPKFVSIYSILCCIECLLCCGGPYYCLPAVLCVLYTVYIYLLCCIECLLCCGGPYYCLPAVLCVLYTVCRLQIFTQEDPQLEIYIMLGWLFSLGSYIGTVSGDRPSLGISLFGNFPWIIPVQIRYVLPACLKRFTFVLGFTRLAHLPSMAWR